MRQSGPRIAVIDGLRGIAILLVIYQHVYSVALRDVISKNFGVFPWVIGHGWMGVSLFFILSGFVLALPFFVAPGQMTTLSSALHFYARRSKRLLPLFFFMAFVSFAVAVHSNPGAFRSLVLTLSTASMFTTREFFPSINAPFWSLALEIWFSVLFPILLIAVVRTSTMAIAISIGSIALGVRIVGTDFPFINSNVNPVKDSVPARLDDFVVGMALARLYATNRLPQLRSYHALLGIACIALAGALWDLAPSLPRAMVSLFNVVVQGGVALVLIAALNSKTRVATLLSIWPL